MASLHFQDVSLIQDFLVGGFNPSEKYACQMGSFPQTGMKIPNIFAKNPEPESFPPSGRAPKHKMR